MYIINTVHHLLTARPKASRLSLMPAAPAKAVSAAKAVKRGTCRKSRRQHFSVHFHRPEPQKVQRKPVVLTRAVKPLHDDPVMTTLVRRIDTHKAKTLADRNVLVFIAHRRATKPQIAAAVEAMMGVHVAQVNTLNAMREGKKAYVRLTAQHDARQYAL